MKCRSPTYCGSRIRLFEAKRIDGRVNAFFRNRSFEVDERVELAERGGRGRIGRIVGRDVHGLDRRDCTAACRGDTFLQRTHFGGQRWLVTYCGGHTAEERGHFAARLREAENVVDEEQGVGTGLVAEIFGHREGRESDAETGSGRLVHLAEDHARLIDNAAAGVADFGFLHFEPEARAFTRTLADAGEHGVTAVGGGDAGDQLGENNRLAETGTAEQTGFTTADERREQVDNLDAGFEQLGLGRQIAEGGRVAVDRPILVGIDRAAAVDRFARDVEHAAERGFADGNLYRFAGVDAVLAADEAVGAAERDATDATAAQVLLHFAGEVDLHAFVIGDDLHGVVDRRQACFFVFDVEGRADDLRDASDVVGCFCSCGGHEVSRSGGR